MDKLNLVSKDKVLTLVAESDWYCNVYFSDHKSYKNFYLGVNSVDFVCSQFISAISKKSMIDEVTYNHENSEVFWIISLYIQHGALYGNASDEGFKLFYVEDEGGYLPTIELDQTCIKKWVKKLCKFQKKYQTRNKWKSKLKEYMGLFI